MLKILIPVILSIVGAVGGLFIGVTMKPEPPVEEMAEGEAKDAKKADKEKDEYAEADPYAEEEKAEDSEYFEISRKIIVPVMDDGGRFYIAVELSVELAPGGSSTAESHEPKLRDALLRTLITFAHTGAFSDDAHPQDTFEELGRELKRAARRVIGDDVRDVLIADLIKQRA